MGVVASIVSAVLKSVVGDKLGSGLARDLIGISIDGISEKGINEITDFINKGKSKIDSILSKENMESMGSSEDNIDYVVAEIKDLLSKINITDEVLRQCKYNNMILKDFMWNEYVAYKNMLKNIEHEDEIKTCLFAVAETLTRVMRESESFSQKMLIQISNAVDDANVGLQNISDYMKENFGRLDDKSQIVLNLLLVILEQIQEMNMQCIETKNTADEEKKFKNNKKEDYIKNWNSRLFLHIDNDENPLTLADAFIMPDYEKHKSINRIGFSYDDTLDKIVEKFVKYDRTSTMLIAGVPGIGKSSITSWIANEYKDDDRVIVLRFRDWKNEELSRGLFDGICNTLQCVERDLDNKIIVLDGFDEIKALDIRNELLDLFFNDILDYKNIKCIITSRTNYIDRKQFDNVFDIKTFSVDKIIKFCSNISGKIYERSEILNSNNLEVLGVPVILYMALMSNIDITKTASKPELYSRIFAEQGGIFDRFAHEGIPYSDGNHILRNPTNINKYLRFLCGIAFTMFEKNNPSLHYGEFQIPELTFQKGLVSILEFPLKQLFETTEKSIEFIHQSIYEYFLAEYIIETIENVVEQPNSNEINLAGVLGDILRNDYLSKEILEFLKYKIANSNLNFSIVNKSFQLMLQDGMTYHAHKNYKNVIKCERYIFANMLELIHLYENSYIKINDSAVYYLNYINYDNYFSLNLEGVDLSNTNLSGINFRYANLCNANLKNAKLIDAILERANLSGADFTGADLTRANLSGAMFYGAIFKSANLTEVDLSEQFLQNVNFSRAILRRTCFKKAYLSKAIMTETVLDDANFRPENIEDSVWMEEDVKAFYNKLEKIKFYRIIIIHQGKEKNITKTDLFSPENIFNLVPLKNNLDC